MVRLGRLKSLTGQISGYTKLQTQSSSLAISGIKLSLRGKGLGKSLSLFSPGITFSYFGCSIMSLKIFSPGIAFY